MKLSLTPFPNSIAITYMCPPEVFVLSGTRYGHTPPLNLPDHKIAMRVWVELPAFEAAERGRWVEKAAAWVVENCYEIEREIRCQLIQPVFLN